MSETKMEYRVIDNFRRPEIVLHVREAVDLRAKYVMDLIERWSMVSAVDDGEDSQGRAKLSTLEPSDVVSRAFRITDLTFDELERRGWIIALPSLEEMDEDIRVRREADEAEEVTG